MTVIIKFVSVLQFYMSPSLALIGLCVVPPVSVLAVIYGRFVRGITRQLQDSLAETSEVNRYLFIYILLFLFMYIY